MKRTGELERITKETRIRAKFSLDGNGLHEVSSGIGFFDHMLVLFTVHGLFDLNLTAQGDLEIDWHHTVEDVGLVLGAVIGKSLGDHKGICRYGNSVVPMDDALAQVTVDLSNRPYLVFNVPEQMPRQNDFDISLAREFFRAVAQNAGMNLHIQLFYGDNWHHMIEAVFKGLGRALRQAASLDDRVIGIPSSKGKL
jgi:imidazoleglycerol-phosphate dehydratase